VFVIVIAAIIIVLSMAFIIMSLNIIIQKNRDLFVNLYNIGYSTRRIARFYQIVVSAITLADMLVAVIVALRIRAMYIDKLASLFQTTSTTGPILISAAALTLLFLIIYNWLIHRNIAKTVE
jgi:hypothetical protein